MLRKRGLLAVVVVAVTAGLALLLLAGLALAAPATSASRLAAAAPASGANASVGARLRISVPFGIASDQQLIAGGQKLKVDGHAMCWGDSQMFDVHVRVAQSTTNSFGEAHTIAACDQSVDQQAWTAVASAESGQGDSSAKFAAGPALACAQATEFGLHGIVDEHAWCKAVTLTTGGY